MAVQNKEKIFSGKWFISYSLIVIGAFVMAGGYVLFISPYKIVPGGVYGIGIILYHLIGIPVGLTGLVLNIPLAIIGVRFLGPRFGVKTVVGFFLASGFIDGLTFFYGAGPLVENDPLLSSIFGGVFIGLGLGLIFKARATSGGSSIIAMLITKYTRIPLGQSLMIIDALIVLLGLLSFGDWTIPLYSLIVIFITGKVIDIVLEGFSYEKTLFIVSDKYDEIAARILQDMNRGGTYLEAKGMYKQDAKKVIFVNVTRREMAVLQDFINQIDPNAFVTVIEASEILGKGFRSLGEKVS
ncbi:MAG: YitT family protein [Bacteroidia bacterium]|nr:MAG: YitT family protein [Bacteroidia bacterium]